MPNLVSRVAHWYWTYPVQTAVTVLLTAVAIAMPMMRFAEGECRYVAVLSITQTLHFAYLVVIDYSVDGFQNQESDK